MYQFNLNTHVEKSWSFVFCFHCLARLVDTASNTTDSLDAQLQTEVLPTYYINTQMTVLDNLNKIFVLVMFSILMDKDHWICLIMTIALNG